MGAIWLMSLVLLLLPNKLNSQSDFTQFNFTSFSENERDRIMYQGDAHRDPIDRIRLTHFLCPESVGRVLYSPAIRLWDGAGRRQATFQTEFRSFIGNSNPHMDGEGVAFFIAPVNATFPGGSSGGNLGLYNPSSGFSPVPVVAAEFDVFRNTWDPNYPYHLGININTRTSIAVAKWGEEVTDFPWRWRVADFRITYDSRERLMTLDVANTVAPFTRARVEHKIDLKTYLPEWVQIGISASTGKETIGFNEIISWSFISFMQHDEDTRSFANTRLINYI